MVILIYYYAMHQCTITENEKSLRALIKHTILSAGPAKSEPNFEINHNKAAIANQLHQ